MMTVIKIQQWQPDTHPGHVIEVEWEYDPDTGRDTGREHRGVSVSYPDGTYVHRDTHGADLAQQHYRALHDEHVVKNHAYKIIAESLPAHMKRPLRDGDGVAMLDEMGQPRLTLKESHRPQFKHLGNGKYEFAVSGIDEATHQSISTKLAQFGDRAVLLKSA